MIEKVKNLLEPEVSLSAKLVGISLFFGKLFDKHDSRILSLEERQLQKGDKGDKGDSVAISDLEPVIKSLYESHIKDEMDDISEIMENTWNKW